MIARIYRFLCNASPYGSTSIHAVQYHPSVDSFFISRVECQYSIQRLARNAEFAYDILLAQNAGGEVTDDRPYWITTLVLF
jgi:hypothetical protein